MGTAANSTGLARRSYIWTRDGSVLRSGQSIATYELKNIVDTMGKVMRSRAPLFQVIHHHRDFIKASPLGTKFRGCLNADMDQIAKVFPSHRHSPLYTLFKRFTAPLRRVGLGRTMFVEDVDTINAAVEKMRAFLKGDALGKALGNLRRCERANLRTSRQLLADIRDRYSKVLVLRLDLGYYSTHAPGQGLLGLPISLEEAQLHRNRLLSYLRKGPLSKHMAGYIWRLEFGIEKGHHYHLAVFLKGQAVAKDIVIADMIGAYWKDEATGGQGMYYSCNKNKEAYARCGIGMVGRSEEDRWAHVEEAISYLTKQDFYLRFRPGPRVRTFGAGGVY